MRKISLKLRVVLASTIALVIFLPLAAFALEQAFVSRLTLSLLEQLRTHSLTMVSEFEFAQTTPYMPPNVHNEKLNVPESGLYALIKVDGRIVWLSESSIAEDVLPLPSSPDVGEEIFEIKNQGGIDYYAYSYTAEFFNDNEYYPVTFFLVQSSVSFNQEVQEFRITLWKWLGIISLILVALLLFSLNTALRPIGNLINQIKRVEKGKAKILEEDYPVELERLKANINHLITTEQSQRQRYKNSLSDLAHSLKTPLAVLLTNDDLPSSCNEPLLQIQQIIERQLKRASANSNGAWIVPEPLFPILNSIMVAMEKIYNNKGLNIHLECDMQYSIRMDKTDAMELLGNLIDNACKAATAHVTVRVLDTQSRLTIYVEDDGAGIPTAQQKAILQRGARLDSYIDGQGIGLALVTDLITAYGATIDINTSDLGGACFTLTFAS